MAIKRPEPQEPETKTECAPVIFISRIAPFFKVRLGQTRYRFENGRLELTVQEHVDELRDAIKRSSMKQHVRELDVNAAEEVVRQHQKIQEAQRGTVAGGVNAEAMRQVSQPSRDEQLRAAGVENVDQFKAEAAEGGLVMTEDAVLPSEETLKADLAKAAEFKAAQEAAAKAENVDPNSPEGVTKEADTAPIAAPAFKLGK